MKQIEPIYTLNKNKLYINEKKRQIALALMSPLKMPDAVEQR